MHLGPNPILLHRFDFLRYRLFRLSRQGVPAKVDRELKADRFCLSVSVRINRCDREPDRDREVLETVLWGEWALQVRNNEEVKSRLLHFKSLVDGI